MKRTSLAFFNRDFFGRPIENYSYLCFSVVFHVLALYLLSNVILKPAPYVHLDQKIRVSLDNTYHMSMIQSVKDTAKIQQQMVETLDETTKKNIQLEPIEDKINSNTRMTSNQLLELARKISENIRKIDRELRAQDLERAVTMSHPDALKTVMSLELAIPEYNANRMPGEEKVRSVEHMEEVAKNYLRRRLYEMDSRGLGDPSSKINKENDKSGVGPIHDQENKTVVKDLIGPNNQFAEQQFSHSKNKFVDIWLDHIPAINQENPKKVAGRILKDGAQYADRIFINSWYIVGPFPISDKKYPPEYAVDLNALYYGKENKVVDWQYLSNSQYPVIPPQNDKAGIFYGYTEIRVDHAQDVNIWVGADDFVQLQLNERVVWDSTSFNKKFNTLAYQKTNPNRDNWNLTEYKGSVHLNAGRNVFKFKLTNSDAQTFFSLVLTK
jgi:hypothetical protein